LLDIFLEEATLDLFACDIFELVYFLGALEYDKFVVLVRLLNDGSLPYFTLDKDEFRDLVTFEVDLLLVGFTVCCDDVYDIFDNELFLEPFVVLFLIFDELLSYLEPYSFESEVDFFLAIEPRSIDFDLDVYSEFEL